MESKPPETQSREHALTLAYRHLNRRERTVGEMRAHLAARGVEDGAADAAIEALVEQGYLDDARFARMFVQDRRELDQWGSERIRHSLLARGIERDLVEAALDGDGAADDARAGDARADDARGGDARADDARTGDAGGDGARTRDGAHGAELERALALLRGRFAEPPRDRQERDRALGVLVRRGYDPELALEALASYARER